MNHHSPLGNAPVTRALTVTELLQRVQAKGYDLYAREAFEKDADPALVPMFARRKGGWVVFSKAKGQNSLVTIDDNVRTVLTNHLFNGLYDECDPEAPRADT